MARAHLALLSLCVACGAAAAPSPRSTPSAAAAPPDATATATSPDARAETAPAPCESSRSREGCAAIAARTAPADESSPAPVDAGLIVLSPPPPRIEASIVTAPQGQRVDGGTYVAFDGRLAYHAVGFPALSADGRIAAVVSSTGDGTSDRYVLVSIATDGRSPGRRDALSESYASEEGTEAEAARLRDARTQTTRAARYVARRGFRSMVRLPVPDAPALEGVPVLEWTEDGWVTIRDPGSERVRFRERIVVPAPGMPDDLDDDEAMEWEDEHRCDVPGLDAAAAWQIDAERVLLETTINPPADECDSSDDHRIVTLAP